MKPDSRPVRTRDGLDFFAFYLLAATLLFAPRIKGGNRPLPDALELAALLLLAYPLLRPVFLQRLPKAFLLGLALFALLPLLQLLPLPFSMWQMLPGRELYAEALAAFWSVWRCGHSPAVAAAAGDPGANPTHRIVERRNGS